MLLKNAIDCLLEIAIERNSDRKLKLNRTVICSFSIVFIQFRTVYAFVCLKAKNVFFVRKICCKESHQKSAPPKLILVMCKMLKLEIPLRRKGDLLG